MNRIEAIVAATRRDLTELRFIDAGPVSGTFSEYCLYYGLYRDDTRSFFGTITTAGYSIFVHIKQPKRPRGTVFLVHGYLTHSAMMRHVVHTLLDNRFVVVMFDLPGHGLSSGERGNINDFLEYRQVLSDIVNSCRQKMPAPFFGLGHSTGASIILDSVFSLAKPLFKQDVLVAPLVHTPYWTMTKLWCLAAKRHRRVFPRRYVNNSSDPSFLHFLRYEDPLQVRQVTFAWLDSMIGWSDNLTRSRQNNFPLLVVQGDRDSTVDWRYNLPFIRKNCRSVREQIIEGGKHELFNESLELRSQVLAEIEAFLN